MDRRLGIALVGLLVVAVLVIVVLISQDADDGPSGPTVEECTEAARIVEDSRATVSQLSEATEIRRGADFYGLLVVEQRTITFVMEERPECFTLAERARADGVHEAFSGLLAIVDPPSEAGDPAGAPPADPDG